MVFFSQPGKELWISINQPQYGVLQSAWIRPGAEQICYVSDLWSTVWDRPLSLLKSLMITLYRSAFCLNVAGSAVIFPVRGRIALITTPLAVSSTAKSMTLVACFKTRVGSKQSYMGEIIGANVN